MNFKQLVLEVIGRPEWFIRYATEKELEKLSRNQFQGKPLEKGWVVGSNSPKNKTKAIYIPSPTDKNVFFLYSTHNSEWWGAVHPDDEINQYIVNFETKQMLSPDTLNTFGDML